MKVHSYAKDIYLNRNVLKKYVETQNFVLGDSTTVNFVFTIPNVLKPFGLFSWCNGLPANISIYDLYILTLLQERMHG